MAEEAYRGCGIWFVPPLDPERQYEIMAWHYSACHYSWFLGDYTITISRRNSTVQEVCRSVGHEMFHRMTMRRPGLHQEMWVSEMLAFLASQWFLNEQGYGSYADYLHSYYIAQTEPVDISYLKRARRTRNPIRILTGQLYTPGIATQIPRLALALWELVNWKNVAQMVGASRLETWVQYLPETLHASVCRILELPCPSAFPDDGDIYHRYATALAAIGRFEEAVTAHRTAMQMEPDRVDILSGLALTLFHNGDVDGAADLWEKAVAMAPENQNLCRNLAIVCEHRKDFDKALDWLVRALEQEASVQIHYDLGCVLIKKGDRQAALEAWQKVIDLNTDSVYSEWAKSAIEQHASMRDSHFLRRRRIRMPPSM